MSRRRRSLASLRFAVRAGVLAHYLGQLLLPLAALSCAPAAVAWATGRPDVAARQLAVVLLLAGCGGLGWRFGRKARLQRNEALVLTALAFAVASLAGAASLRAYGMSPLDAWFEAVSGATTTGLSVLPSIEKAPRGLLFARAWLQWVGGLGVLVLALAALLTPGASARRLGFGSRETVDIEGGTRSHARRVLGVYLALTSIGFAALVALGVAPFDALLHAFTSVSTGGFATHDASLAFYPLRVRIAVLALCFSGAIAFSTYYLALGRPRRRILPDRRLGWLALCCAAVAALLVVAAGVGTTGRGEPPAHAPPGRTALVLTAISAQTTAGFSVAPVRELDPAAKLALVASMIIGGDAGSTAGGIKVFRFLAILGLLGLLFDRASIPPAGRLGLRLGRDRIGTDELEAVVAVVAAYLGVIALSWLVFLLHGYDALDSLFEVTSAVGTVGLSTGLAGPELPPLLKGLLSVDMLMGRVEVVAFLLVLRPHTWIGRRRRT